MSVRCSGGAARAMCAYKAVQEAYVVRCPHPGHNTDLMMTMVPTIADSLFLTLNFNYLHAFFLPSFASQGVKKGIRINMYKKKSPQIDIPPILFSARNAWYYTSSAND